MGRLSALDSRPGSDSSGQQVALPPAAAVWGGSVLVLRGPSASLGGSAGGAPSPSRLASGRTGSMTRSAVPLATMMPSEPGSALTSPSGRQMGLEARSPSSNSRVGTPPLMSARGAPALEPVADVDEAALPGGLVGDRH
jgi:hypothetical protein